MHEPTLPYGIIIRDYRYIDLAICSKGIGKRGTRIISSSCGVWVQDVIQPGNEEDGADRKGYVVRRLKFSLVLNFVCTLFNQTSLRTLLCVANLAEERSHKLLTGKVGL